MPERHERTRVEIEVSLHDPVLVQLSFKLFLYPIESIKDVLILIYNSHEPTNHDLLPKTNNSSFKDIFSLFLPHVGLETGPVVSAILQKTFYGVRASICSDLLEEKCSIFSQYTKNCGKGVKEWQ